MATRIGSKNWLEEMIGAYDYPVRILFRSIELKTIFQSMKDIEIQSPILDIGCGEGRIAKTLFGKAVIDVGLDNLWEEITQAEDRDIYKLQIAADALNLPFSDHTFNFVFSNCVIEHIVDNASLLNNISRILKPHGLFVFTVPSENFGSYLYFYNFFKKMGLNYLADQYQVYRNKTVNHFHCHSPKEWERRLKEVGLKIVKYQYYMPKEALEYWDLLAFKVLILRACFFWIKRDKLLKTAKKFMMRQWGEKIENLYNLKQQDGGALLIIAQK